MIPFISKRRGIYYLYYTKLFNETRQGISLGTKELSEAETILKFLQQYHLDEEPEAISYIVPLLKLKYRPVKQCTKCFNIKSLDEFYKHDEIVSKYRKWCKECVRQHRFNSDTYIVHLLSKSYDVNFNIENFLEKADIPKELLELKKAQLNAGKFIKQKAEDAKWNQQNQ